MGELLPVERNKVERTFNNVFNRFPWAADDEIGYSVNLWNNGQPHPSLNGSDLDYPVHDFTRSEDYPFSEHLDALPWRIPDKQYNRIGLLLKDMDLLPPGVILSSINLEVSTGHIGKDVREEVIRMTCLAEAEKSRFPLSALMQDTGLLQTLTLAYFHTWGSDDYREGFNDYTIYAGMTTPKAVNLISVPTNLWEKYFEEHNALLELFGFASQEGSRKSKLEDCNARYAKSDLALIQIVGKILDSLLI